MKNEWTGGQYSLVRFVFGAYLFLHFVQLVPWAEEIFETVLPRDASPLIRLFPNVLAFADVATPLIVAAAIASVFFALGLFDRIAAIFLWYVLASLFGRNPLISNPSLPFAGWLLLLHACLPPAPFWSLAARGRVDPRGNWSFPPPLFAALWIVMSLGYSYSGWTKLVSPSWVDGTALARVLNNPLARPSFIRDLMLQTPDALMHVATWGALALELLYAPLALFRRARPLLWLAMLLMHLGLMVLIDFADLSFMMVILHLFAFNPAWVPRRATADADLVLYDGTCGLCHRSVRFIVAEDQHGAFTFAPLPEGGEKSSVEVRTGERLLTKSSAVIHILHRLGGYWRVVGFVFSLVPRALRDAGYDFIARIRYRIFGRTKEACPLMPPDLRSRFTQT
jgi:predicted DCC family thiol-disulfide oxidoreductase YuxK